MSAVLSKSLAICVVLITARIPLAAEDWLTDRALDKALAQKVSLTWEEGSRWDFLQQVALERRIALFLDRRVDPSISLTCQVADLDVWGALFQAGGETELAAVQIGDLIYVGPGEQVATLPWRLADLRRRIAKLPVAARTPWLAKSTLKIPRLARPREVLQGLAAATGLPLAGTEQIPHDLLRGAECPGLTVAEQFAVLAFGFGLWPELDPAGKSAQLVPLPPAERFAWTYSVADPAAAKSWLAAERPQAQVAAKAKTVEVTGNPADHLAFLRHTRLTAAPATPSVAQAQTTVTLRATATRQAILLQICSKLGVELQAAAGSGEQLAERVEIDVQRVSYAELIERVLANSGLRYELERKQLRILTK